MNKLEKQIGKMRNEGAEFTHHIKTKVATYITAAFGLVAGLAWSDAIKALIELLVPLGRDSVVLKFVYAIIITIVVVVISVYAIKLSKKEVEK